MTIRLDIDSDDAVPMLLTGKIPPHVLKVWREQFQADMQAEFEGLNRPIECERRDAFRAAVERELRRTA